MIRTIAHRRNNSVAATYVAHALKRNLVRTFHALSSSPCLSCRKNSYKAFIRQRRRLRKMANMRSIRSKSAPAPVMAGPRRAGVSLESQTVVKPFKAVSEPSKGQETGKKRKISESEQLEVKPPQQAKKPRTPEVPVREKAEPKRQKQVNGIKPHEEAPTPTLKKKAPKQDVTTTKNNVPPKQTPAATSRIPNSWPESVGKQKIKGLSNPGNWCYRRSVLQSLIAVPQFFNLLTTTHKSCPKQGKCVTCALRQLLQSYHTSPGGVSRDLHALDTAIRMTGKTSEPRWRASGQTQEDSHEFLQYLLGTVENAKGMPKETFSSLFRIKHKISWTCTHCSKTHIRSDPPGLSLNLPIPKHSSSSSGGVPLSSCLETYHREPNVLIRCDACKKNAKRTRVFKIDTAPEVLNIQLLRFGFSSYGPTKNKQHVDFPDELDLSPWAAAAAAEKAGKVGGGGKTAGKLKYRLKAVVAHSGSLKFGHYIAYVRQEGSTATGGDTKIWDISDSDVSGSSAREWRRPGNGFNPYILVYVRE